MTKSFNSNTIKLRQLRKILIFRGPVINALRYTSDQETVSRSLAAGSSEVDFQSTLLSEVGFGSGVMAIREQRLRRQSQPAAEPFPGLVYIIDNIDFLYVINHYLYLNDLEATVQSSPCVAVRSAPCRPDRLPSVPALCGSPWVGHLSQPP